MHFDNLPVNVPLLIVVSAPAVVVGGWLHAQLQLRVGLQHKLVHNVSVLL